MFNVSPIHGEVEIIGAHFTICKIEFMVFIPPQLKRRFIIWITPRTTTVLFFPAPAVCLEEYQNLMEIHLLLIAIAYMLIVYVIKTRQKLSTANRVSSNGSKRTRWVKNIQFIRFMRSYQVHALCAAHTFNSNFRRRMRMNSWFIWNMLSVERRHTHIHRKHTITRYN